MALVAHLVGIDQLGWRIKTIWRDIFFVFLFCYAFEEVMKEVAFSELNQPIEELRWYYFEIVAGTRRSWGWRQVWWKMTNLGEGCFSRFSFNFKFGLIFFIWKLQILALDAPQGFDFPRQIWVLSPSANLTFFQTPPKIAL